LETLAVIRRSGLAVIAAALLAVLNRSPASATPAEIPVILPLSGSATFLGVGEQTALRIAEGVINQTGGVHGVPLRFAFYDDQSSPQVAVQLTSRIKSTHSPVVLGSALVAMCNAMASVLADGPVMYCLSPGIHPMAGSNVFTAFISTHDLAHALVTYYRGRGFKRLAMITSTDASGQDGRRGFEAALQRPENKDLQLVSAVQFNPADVSVSAQIEQIRAAKSDALIVWTSGSPMGTVLKGIVQGGLDVPVGTTDANMTYAQMHQYAAFLPTEMLYMSAEWPPHGRELVLDGRVNQAQTEMFAAYAAAGVRPDNAVAHAWDVAMLIVRALEQAGPDATPAKVRAVLATTKDWPGIDGVYDFAREPQRGLDITDSVVTRWQPDRGTWTIVSKPGGAPP
jgi:branched-chain amino acid transport system substrate-binding protein